MKAAIRSIGQIRSSSRSCGLAWSVVDDDDVTELLRRQPTCKVVGVEGAGHSIQGDRPVELAQHLTEFLSEP